MREDNREPHLTQIYCNNEGCVARQIEVYTKDHLPHKRTKDPKDWCCPVCGGPVKVHWRRGREEDMKRQLGAAIGEVNAALYMRDHNTRAVRADVWMLDKLPESWKCVED